MPISRRDFLTTSAAAAVIPALGRHGELFAAVPRVPRPVTEGLIRVDKNENPMGPFATARSAIIGAMSEANRYPGSAASKLGDAIASMHGVKSEQVVLGCGSGEILKICTEQFTTATRGLVQASPTFEACGSVATLLGHPVVAVPVTESMHLDLDAMAASARGGGLVYLCNPNNPTSTVHGASAVKGFIARVRRDSPETYILVDEAYHEYVEEPSYATMIPETHDSHVIVSRTFSKVFGMAGVRVGYAIAASETASRLNNVTLDSNVNQFAAAGALAALADTAAIRAEQQRNRDVRAFTIRWFNDHKFTVAKCDANFLFVDIKRDVSPVIAACLDKNVAVGRPFPPLTTHLRVSIGKQAEMEQALSVLGKVLA